MWLFKASDSIEKWEEDTGWREYWVWTGLDKGWKHRTQIFDERALSRIVERYDREADYGTQEYLNRKASKAVNELAQEKHKKKGRLIFNK